MDPDMNGARSRAVPLTTGEITVSGDVDMEPTGSDTLHNDDNDSLPDLMELSDSSSESGSVQSSEDEPEVMMQAVDGDQNAPTLSTSHGPSPAASPFPTLPAFQPPMRSHNRRARVEDDEDEERDRRHPSQRVSSSIRDFPSNSTPIFQTPSSEPAQPQPPPRPNTHIRTTLNLPSLARMGLDQADPLRFFQHLMPQQPQTQQHGANNTPTPSNNNPMAAPQPNRPASSAAPTPQVAQNQPHGGFSFIVLPPWFRLLPPPRIMTHPGNAHTAVPGNDNGSEPETMALFTEILMRLGALGALLGGSMAEPESEDPERAKKLVDGLEEVPIGLVRRLARVGGTDDPDGGRDTMCAICWDQLLDEAGFGKNPATEGDVLSPQSDTSSSQMTESSIPEEQPEELKQPKIVVLPCAHVFHAGCLIPWFSRPKQTTCPSCRFNIDPENLTRTRRSRRPTPMRPAQPNAAADAAHGAQQPAQDANAPSQPTNGNADNANPQLAGNDNPHNGPGGHFIFDTLQVPIILAAPPIISVNLDGLPNTANGGAHPVDGMQGIPNDIMEQIRARMQEQLNDRAGQGNQQPSHDTNGAATDASPPTQSATSVGSPPPPPGPGLQPQSDNDQGTTHSIIFGFDVLVGGPRPEGNVMGVDGRAGNGTGRDGDQNWFSMMMRDFERNHNDAPAADTGTAAANNNDTGRNNAGQERPAGQAQNGTGAPGQGQGLPQFLDMNFGNGDSVHIASGMGRTVGEAMAQLLSRMTNSGNQGPANTDAETGGNATQNDNTNPEAAEPPTNGPADENRQGQTQNQQNQEGGMFANMTSFPFQMMSQMFGLGSPIRVRRRQSQGHDQPSNTDTSAASQASQPGDNARPTDDAPPAEQGGGGGAPQPNDNDNAADGDEGPFTRFMRNMMAGNVPMPDGATGGQTANGAAPPPPHIHFFPPGFAIRTDPPSSTPSNAQQPQKQQWTPPPAPGPTLRERIEKREREVGLRCCDMSCGVGPSDEEPLIVLTTEGMKQLALKPVNFDGMKCPHTFHPACLVSAERVALRGADAPIVGDDVEVSCSVCRAMGRVSKMDWEEGVQQLA